MRYIGEIKMKKNLVFTIALLFLLIPKLANACAFDLDCNIGSKCMKPSGSIYGYCVGGMNPGNSNDSQPAYNPLDISGKQGDTCSWDLECGIGNACYKSNFSLYGTCLPK